MKPESTREERPERAREETDYVTLGCFIAAVLIVLVSIGIRVSYDIGNDAGPPPAASEPKRSPCGTIRRLWKST
jgi:hypothetical protein